jgi:hypothetical protein
MSARPHETFGHPLDVLLLYWRGGVRRQTPHEEVVAVATAQASFIQLYTAIRFVSAEFVGVNSRQTMGSVIAWPFIVSL